MKIYIAGPIYGKPDRNRAAFRDMAEIVRNQACATPVVPEDIQPREHPGYACPPGRTSVGTIHTECCHMRADIAELVTCDGIILLEGWQQSFGARMELNVATHCGIPVYLYDPFHNEVRKMK